MPLQDGVIGNNGGAIQRLSCPGDDLRQRSIRCDSKAAISGRRTEEEENGACVLNRERSVGTSLDPAVDCVRTQHGCEVHTRLWTSQVLIQIIAGTAVPLALLALTQLVRLSEARRRLVYGV